MTPLLHAEHAKAKAQATATAGADDPPPTTFEARFGETVANLMQRLEPIALEVEAAVAPANRSLAEPEPEIF